MSETTGPPASAGRRVVLVHGATSGPWVFDGAVGWPGDDVRVPDLQEGLDVAHATMSDYANRVLAAVGDPDWPVETGTYDAKSAYGPSVPGMRHRPESLLARCERKRGISIPVIDCPLLVVLPRLRGHPRSSGGRAILSRTASRPRYQRLSSNTSLPGSQLRPRPIAAVSPVLPRRSTGSSSQGWPSV